MKNWPELENALITSSRMYTIGEKDDVQVLAVINPQRGAGESGMAYSVIR